MNTILGELGKSPKFVELVKNIENQKDPIVISGLTEVGEVQQIVAINEFTKKPVCIVTYNEIQAKRIVDFLSGTIYAIGGDLQKIGGGIFLCTPNNVNIQGKITDEKEGKDIHDNNDINIEW